MNKRIAMCLWMAVLGIGCLRAEEPGERQGAKAAEPQAAVVELTPEGIKNAQIKVVTLQPTTFAPHVRIPATIGGDPRKVAQVGSRAPGRVTAIRVQLGDRVRRGQPLIELDAVEVHQATLDYVSASARLRAAEDGLARQRQLVAERVGAIADLRRSESDEAAARAAMNEANEHLRFLGISGAEVGTIGRTSDSTGHRAIVRAPIDGRVAGMDVTLGQVLTGNETIVTVTDLDRVAAILRVYERDVAVVKSGAHIEIVVPAYPGRAFIGTIGFVGDIVDPGTRTLQARADLDNADGALKPGMTAMASVPVPTDDRRLWLPVEAVQTHEGAPAVFVSVGERKFVARPVSVGDERGGYIPVIAGVEAGTPVVVKGALALRGELERAALVEP